MHRTKAGKSLALTSRDLEMFRALSRYRYLRSTYLHAFAGGASETRFRERLGDLFHEGFLDRPVAQWQFAEARHRPVLYELNERSRRILKECEIADDAYTFLAGRVHRQFAHTVMICECLASIELATRGRDDLRFIPWPEILGRAPDQTKSSAMPQRIPVGAAAVVPDALFGLEYRWEGKKGYRFFALEADRGTMPIVRTSARASSLVGKLAAYRPIIERKLCRAHWGISSLLVMTITTDLVRHQSILNKLGEAAHPAFLFKPVEPRQLAVPIPDILTGPWERRAHSPMRVDLAVQDQ